MYETTSLFNGLTYAITHSVRLRIVHEVAGEGTKEEKIWNRNI